MTLNRTHSSLLVRGGSLGPGVSGERGERVRTRLLESGSIAARFATYLGSRVDLLGATDCLRLLEVPDRGDASPPRTVAQLVGRELGARPESLFTVFEREPFDSGLVFQWHNARLVDGERIVVQVVHPELESRLSGDELRRLIERMIAEGELPRGVAAAVAEFERQMDLRNAAQALERLAEAAEGSRRLAVPDVHGSLCSSRVLVVSAGSRGPVDATSSLELQNRRLARAWLGTVLRGSVFPVCPWGREVRVEKGGRVLFVGTEVHRLGRQIRDDLQRYLTALAVGDTSQAAREFTGLLLGKPTERRLRFRLRHADPFRDPRLDIGGDLFVRRVLAHWRTAEELGHRAAEGLEGVFRGLFLLNHEVRGSGDDSTIIRDGLREVRLLLLAGELSDDVGGGLSSSALGSQLSLLSDSPRRLVRILDLAADPDRTSRAAVGRERDREPRAGADGRVVAACLLALGTVALLTRYFADAGASGEWAERVGSLIVLLLGGLLLRVVTPPSSD